MGKCRFEVEFVGSEARLDLQTSGEWLQEKTAAWSFPTHIKVTQCIRLGQLCIAAAHMRREQRLVAWQTTDCGASLLLSSWRAYYRRTLNDVFSLQHVWDIYAQD